LIKLPPQTSQTIGDLISCGSCPSGQQCKADGTGCEPTDPRCVPRTTCTADRQCGTQDDGCEGVVLCGSLAGACPANQFCDAGACKPVPINPPACTVDKPAVCGARVCGSVADGCGGIVSCGGCSAGATCSSDGSKCVDPQQPCTPLAQCSAAAACGSQVRASSAAGLLSFACESAAAEGCLLFWSLHLT
jgi:hypothetical protein